MAPQVKRRRTVVGETVEQFLDLEAEVTDGEEEEDEDDDELGELLSFMGTVLL